MRRGMFLGLLILFQLSHAADLTVENHPDGVNFSVQTSLPEPGKIWLGEKFIEFSPFKNSAFEKINHYVAKNFGSPLVLSDKEYVYIAKVACRLKFTPTFLNKEKYLTYDYQQKGLPSVKLDVRKTDPLEFWAMADLFGFVTLKATLTPVFLTEDELKDSSLLEVTPVELPAKAVTLRVSGKFNKLVSRMVTSSAFYQISDTELLGTTHVLVSVEKNWKTNGIGGGIFKGYLSDFIKDSVVKGLRAIENE